MIYWTTYQFIIELPTSFPRTIVQAYLPNYLFFVIYPPTYLPIYLLNYLPPSHVPLYKPTYLTTCLLLLTYLPTNQFTYLPKYLLLISSFNIDIQPSSKKFITKANV